MRAVIGFVLVCLAAAHSTGAETVVVKNGTKQRITLFALGEKEPLGVGEAAPLKLGSLKFPGDKVIFVALRIFEREDLAIDLISTAITPKDLADGARTGKVVFDLQAMTQWIRVGSEWKEDKLSDERRIRVQLTAAYNVETKAFVLDVTGYPLPRPIPPEPKPKERPKAPPPTSKE